MIVTQASTDGEVAGSNATRSLPANV
jgi:hypothetical protein